MGDLCFETGSLRAAARKEAHSGFSMEISSGQSFSAPTVCQRWKFPISLKDSSRLNFQTAGANEVMSSPTLSDIDTPWFSRP